MDMQGRVKVFFHSLLPADGKCETEFANNMTFKVVTSILNFYIPTACMVVIYVRIYLVIKRRSREVELFGGGGGSGGRGGGRLQKASAAAAAGEKRGKMRDRKANFADAGAAASAALLTNIPPKVQTG